MNSHQIVDLIVLAVLLYCAVKGASRGLLSQLAWVVALLLCFKFSGTLAPAIEPMIGVEPPLQQWIAMLAVYVGLCGVSFVAAGMLGNWMEKAKIKDFDRHLGGLLGLVKGVIICMTIMYFVITRSSDMSQVVSKTYSGYAAAVILHHSQYLVSLVPEDRVKDVSEVIDKFNQNLQPGSDDLNGAKPADPGLFGDSNALLSESVPDAAGLILNDFLSDSPVTDEQDSNGQGSDISPGSPTATQLSRTETILLNEIAGFYPQRNDIISRARQYFAGVPREVQRQVLDDWHADAMGLNTDPDPSTDVNTTLDQRILRQLQKSGISLKGLAPELRIRLSKAVP